MAPLYLIFKDILNRVLPLNNIHIFKGFFTLGIYESDVFQTKRHIKVPPTIFSVIDLTIWVFWSSVKFPDKGLSTFLMCSGLLMIIDFLILCKLTIYNKGFPTVFAFIRFQIYLSSLKSFKSFAISMFLHSLYSMDSFMLRKAWSPIEDISTFFAVTGFYNSMNSPICTEVWTNSKCFPILLTFIGFLIQVA